MVKNDLNNKAKRILEFASSIQQFANNNNLGNRLNESGDDSVMLYHKIVTDIRLREVTEVLFKQGHYALAVEEAYKFLNNFVKARSNLTLDGADLMRQAFSANKPLLRINPFKTSSQKDQQRGYMDILAGCMTGIRNPRAHEHRYLDSPQPALEMLSLANHLTKTIRMSKKVTVSK